MTGRSTRAGRRTPAAHLLDRMRRRLAPGCLPPTAELRSSGMNPPKKCPGPSRQEYATSTGAPHLSARDIGPVGILAGSPRNGRSAPAPGTVADRQGMSPLHHASARQTSPAGNLGYRQPQLEGYDVGEFYRTVQIVIPAASVLPERLPYSPGHPDAMWRLKIAEVPREEYYSPSLIYRRVVRGLIYNRPAGFHFSIRKTRPAEEVEIVDAAFWKTPRVAQ